MRHRLPDFGEKGLHNVNTSEVGKANGFFKRKSILACSAWLECVAQVLQALTCKPIQAYTEIAIAGYLFQPQPRWTVPPQTSVAS